MSQNWAGYPGFDTKTFLVVHMFGTAVPKGKSEEIHIFVSCKYFVSLLAITLNKRQGPKFPSLKAMVIFGEPRRQSR